MSVLSVLLAAGSAAVAWRALDQANDARQIALAGAGAGAGPGVGGTAPAAEPTAAAPPPVAETTAVPEPSAAPTTGPDSTEAPELNPETRYTIKYEKEILDLQWPRSCSGVSVDLDTPRVIVDDSTGMDIRLGNCSGNAPYLVLEDGAQGALMTSAIATPQECAERIQKGPLLPGSQVPARQAQVVCVLTSFAAARRTGDTTKMVRVEIKGVANNERVTVETTAWDIP